MNRLEEAPGSWRHALAQLAARNLRPAKYVAGTAPLLRGATNADTVQNLFLAASLPAFAIGAWASGARVATAAAASEGAGGHWQWGLAAALDLTGADVHWLGQLALGLACIAPALLVAAAVTAFWELAFAVSRQRRVDAGWPMLTWLFVLLLPVTTPLYMVALGATFAVVIGKHIFGGTGRYIVSPALLGVVFLSYAYSSEVVMPASAGMPSWSLVAAGAIEIASATGTWLAALLGRESGTIGTPSALACLLGAAYLAQRGAISARTVGGAVLGLIATAALFAWLGDTAVAQLGWHWHLSLGSFGFAVAFVATDPTTMPLTRTGRWVYGALIGILTVTIRVANPAHPEGSLTAVLLAGLCVPLIDAAVMRVKLRARRARAAEIARG